MHAAYTGVLTAILPFFYSQDTFVTKVFPMGIPLPKNGIALVLLLVMLSITLGGVVCLGAHPHAAPTADVVATHADGDAPCCPDSGDSDGDHCQSCLSCPCQAPLTGNELRIGYSPSIRTLSFSDYLVPPPDVYLSKFVPPQNLA